MLSARLIFAAIFAMAASFEFFDMQSTPGDIASEGFPVPLALAWIAAIFEIALALGFLTGANFQLDQLVVHHSWPFSVMVEYRKVGNME